jgi:Tol biopolymer transport system component
MKLSYLTLLAASLLLFITCKEEKVKPVAENREPCELLPENPGIGWGWDYNTVYPLYYNAVINPNNSQEIAYQYADSALPYTTRLFKINLQTGEKKLLADGVTEGPDYSIKGWLVFIRGSGIWIVKDNGDSLRQLPSEGVNYSPSWSPDGNTVIFSRSINSHYYTLLMDMQGHLDTIRNIRVRDAHWSPDGAKIIAAQDSEIIFIRMPSKKISRIPADPSTSPVGLRWLTNNEFIYSNRLGLHSYNLSTQSSRLLIPACESVAYFSPTVIPGRRDILFTKRVLSPISTRSLSVTFSIVKFNPDSKTFTHVNIP